MVIRGQPPYQKIFIIPNVLTDGYAELFTPKKACFYLRRRLKVSRLIEYIIGRKK